MTAEEKAAIGRLLGEYADVFVEPDGKLGTTSEAEHVIDLSEAAPLSDELRGPSDGREGVRRNAAERCTM